MNVRVYLYQDNYAHIDFEDVESIQEAEDRYIQGDYDRDDIVATIYSTDWEIDVNANSDILEEWKEEE